MSPAQVIIIGDARAQASARYETLATMFSLRHRVDVIDLSELRREQTGALSFDDLATATEHEVTVRRVPGASAVLIGFGIGASLALTLALRDAQRNDLLVLVGGWLNAPPSMRQLVTRVSAIRQHDEKLAEETLSGHLTSAQDWREIPAAPVDWNLLELGAELALGGDALGLTTPTLVVGCSFDEFATADQSQLLYGAIPAARYVELPTGHDVAQSRPGELFSLIEVFVNEHHDYAPGTVFRRSTP